MRALTVLCDRVGEAGGAERYWETVLPALAARFSSVLVLARDLAGPVPAGIEAREIAWADEHGPPSDRAAREVRSLLRERAPDVVVSASVFDPLVLDAVRAGAKRWIARLHDHRAFCPTGDRVFPQFEHICSARMGAACRINTLLRGCVRGPRPSSRTQIALRAAVRDRLARADAVVVSSAHMRATCAANGIAPSRVVVLHPPLPDAAFTARPAARGPSASIVFASRLTPRKGLRSLLRALALLTPAERPRLVVAGEGGAEEHAAREQAERDGIATEWRGRLSPPALRDAIDGADAVAVPSLWPEPFGLVGIEAQARGRPAVAYRVGGIPDWIGGAGIAVERGDERALAGALRTILDRRDWPSFAAAARARAEAYRLEEHVERMTRVLEGTASA